MFDDTHYTKKPERCSMSAAGSRPLKVVLMIFALIPGLYTGDLAAQGPEGSRLRKQRLSEPRERAPCVELGPGRLTAGARSSVGIRPLLEVTSPMRFQVVVESGAASFGEVLVGDVVRLRRALSIRVISDRVWTLRLRGSPRSRVAGRVDPPRYSRLGWRISGAGPYQSFPDSGEAILASGSATSGAGHLISVDLMLEPQASDSLGEHEFAFQVVLEGG